jgi:cell division protein FtsQ
MLEKVAGKEIKGKEINKMNLLEMENQIKKDVWISKATLYFDKNDILMVKVEEKNPIARVFSNQGTSFYIDHSLNMLPLSKKHSARLPVFTNFPSALKKLSSTMVILSSKKFSIIFCLAILIIALLAS